MRKLAILSVLVFITGLLTAATTDLPKDTSVSGTASSAIRSSIYLPYAEDATVSMQKVLSKDEYVLWKCPAGLVKDFPGKNITGKSYNYFVYKNGKFHMTVTDMNKDSVYRFFAEKE